MSVLTVRWYDRTDTWTTKTGEEIRLEDLEPSHRRNILRFIARRIKRVRFAEEMRWLVEVALHDGGDMAHDALEQEFHFAQHSDPVAFYNSLPLVKALKALEPKVIVRVASHRANEKLQGIVPVIERQELYSWQITGAFVEIPAYRLGEVRLVKGVTRARNQDRDFYSETWRSGNLTERAKREIFQWFGEVAR